MLRFVVRRLLLLVPILLGVSLLVFGWIRALPGSPAEALLGEHATPHAIQQIRHQYGLDKPIPGDGRARARGNVLVDPRRYPDRLLRGEAIRERLRPPIARRLPDRDLDSDLLPRPDPEMDLRGEARLAAEHRP